VDSAVEKMREVVSQYISGLNYRARPDAAANIYVQASTDAKHSHPHPRRRAQVIVLFHYSVDKQYEIVKCDNDSRSTRTQYDVRFDRQRSKKGEQKWKKMLKRLCTVKK
jgi:hypothetical protein